jgi:hypothetical protein
LKMRSRLLLPLLITLACISCTSHKQKDPAALEAEAAARIDAIPPPDPQRFRDVRSSKAWRNPYLIVKPDGVALLDVNNNEERYVDPDELTQVLAQLPASAWPYGRVVAVTEVGILGSEDDKSRIRKNRAIVAGTLEGIHVLINWIPSA